MKNGNNIEIKPTANKGFAIVGRNCKVQRLFLVQLLCKTEDLCFDCPTIAKPRNVSGHYKQTYLKNMSGFKFNKVYVIESLDSTKDKLTGQELYEDLLRRKTYQIKDFKSELFQIETKKDFFEKLEHLKNESITEGYYPILHFEIHGSEDNTGLVLKSNELVTWEELVTDLRDLNTIIENNLFITMAVCFGAYIMRLIKVSEPSPFWGIIGSFEEIYVYDLIIRYNEFYTEFLENFDLNKAVEKLHNANPNLESSFKFINSEQTFINVNKKYFSEKFTPKAIGERFKDGIKQEGIKMTDRNAMHEFRLKFTIELHKSKRQTFEEHKEAFFMIDKFPGNAERFKDRYEDVK